MVFLAFAENSVQLVPDGWMFLHIALILIMIWVLNNTLFKPVNRVLQERERKTGGSAGSAQDIILESENKLATYEQGLRQARAEGYAVVEQTRKEAVAARNEQIETVKTEIEQMIISEKEALHKQILDARGELLKDAQILAERISNNIIRPSVGGKTA